VKSWGFAPSQQWSERFGCSQVVDDVGDLAFIHAGATLSTFADGAAITVSVQSFGSVEAAEDVLRDVARTAVLSARRAS